MNPWHIYLLWILAGETRYIRSWVFLCPSLINGLCFVLFLFWNVQKSGKLWFKRQPFGSLERQFPDRALQLLALSDPFISRSLFFTVGYGPLSETMKLTQIKRQFWCRLFEFCLFWDKALLYTPGWRGISYVAQLASNLLRSSCLCLWSARITDVCTRGLVINTDRDWNATWPSKWQQFQTIPLSIKLRSRSMGKVTWTIQIWDWVGKKAAPSLQATVQ